MKKYILFVFYIFLLLILFQPSKSEYWKKIDNLPKSAERTQWLDVFFIDENHGWICGRSFSDGHGKVARTTDGGATWKVDTLPIWFLESVHFANIYNGFCSGPDGVYKTTDGGATWTPISYLNNLLGDIDIWGCYMLNNDTVYVIGGGCSAPIPTDPLQDHRLIWRSTNGGATWTYFDLSYVPVDGTTNYFSGLTDIVVHPNGIGFASGSGLIWKTDNYGDSWSLASRTSNYLSWQEEITNIINTNTVLVPFSGLDCGGGSPNLGGMRFATDATNPATWKERLSAGPMYGSFLISPTEGWSCGTYRGVYYTNNSGDSWQLLNCGIDVGDNLDDIFFITPQKGWVVGDNIYTLAPSEMLVNKDTVDFGDSCTSRIVYDTLTVKNMNFGSSIIDISVYQDNPSFSIVQPSYLNYPLPPCGEVHLVVKYSPKTTERHKYSIIINLAPTNEAGVIHRDTIYYFGALREFTAKAEKDTIDFGDIPIRTNSYKTLKWTSQSQDTIVKYISDNVYPDITDVTMDKPFVVRDTGSIMRFMISPIDTGYIYIKYTFVFSTCGEEREVVLKARGISPIIKCDTLQNINILCKADSIIKIPIYNSGNAPLEIYRVEFDSLAHNKYQPEIIGFSDNKNAPVIIAPQKYDTLHVKFNSNTPDTQKVNLIVAHNDTKRKNSTSPTLINIQVIFYKTILSHDKIEINFGDICVGDSITRLNSIKNLGNQNIIFSDVPKTIPEFVISTTSDSILAGNSISYSVKFAPKQVGIFTDTLEISANPCSAKCLFILRGRGVDNNILITPTEIKDKINTNITKNYEIEIKSNSIQPIEIKSIDIIPHMSELDIVFLDNFPVILFPNSTRKISFSVSSSSTFEYSGNLNLYLESACIDTMQVPINIEFIEHIISYTDNNNNPIANLTGYTTCTESTTYDTILVHNNQPYIFKSVYFENKNLTEYKIEEISRKLPNEIEANSKVMLITSFTPTHECNLSNNLIFEMINKATGEIKFDTLFFHHEFYKSNIKTLTNFNENINNISNINFGLFENCDKDTAVYISFINTGKLADTLRVTSVAPDYYSVTPAQIILPPDTKDSIAIIFYPNRITEIPTHKADTLVLSTSVCKKDFRFNLENRIDKISLDIFPQFLDFTEVWINSSDTLILTIRNNSEFDILLQDISIIPNNYFFVIDTVPLQVKSKSEIYLPVMFSANETNSYSAKMILTAARSCIIENKIELAATVPLEKYYISLHFDTTMVQPGSPAVISAYVDSTAPELAATEIKCSVSMNNLLFFPEKVYLLANNNKKELEFDFSFENGLSTIIYGDDANYVLSNKQKFLEIKGLALLFQPDETPISFGKFEITTDKIHEVNQVDGKFKLKNYCGENDLFRNVTFLPVIKPIYQEVIFNNIFNINIISTDEMPISFDIINNIGQVIFSKLIYIRKGENEHEINLDNFSSGTYSIRFRTNYYPDILGKIIIIK